MSHRQFFTKILGHITLVAFLTYFSAKPAFGSDKELINFANTLAQEVEKLPIGDFGLNYQDNLKSLPKLSELNSMILTVKTLSSQFDKITKSSVSNSLYFLYDHIQFELEALSMRLQLESGFLKNHEPIPGRFYKLSNKRDWYTFYLMKWVSDRVTPQEVYDYGVSEVNRIKGEIEKIQKTLGYEGRDNEFIQHLHDDIFFIKNEPDIKVRYSQISDTVSSHLSELFFPSDIPVLKVERDPNSGKAVPPGYYRNSTFYFNFFGEPYNWRVMEWLFIHEAIPGHHYQKTYRVNHPAPNWARVFNWYSGFQEGWAAYTENLGGNMGLYQNLYSQLGKWEWDIVRSARLVLDVGLNYKGWSKDQALAYWKNNIKGQDHIMEREIDRILRWPVQVITYKMGEKLIKELYRREKLKPGFDIRQFHHDLLQYGPIPLPALRSLPPFLD